MSEIVGKLTNQMWFSVVCTLTVSSMICVITVVKMLWNHKVQQTESTTNFDHCDDANSFR